MYKNQFILSLLAIVMLLFNCETNKVEPYDGPSQLHFISETGRIIIGEENPNYLLELGVTRPANYDRTFSLVVDTEKSEAEEGVHYAIPEYNFTIKAGEVMTQVPVQGLYENSDSLGLALNLSVKAENDEDIAGFRNEFELNLYRFCDFNRDEFIGDFKVIEKSNFGDFEYEVKIKKGDDPFSIKVTGLWEVYEEEVIIRFDPSTLECRIDNQFFFDNPSMGYYNVWIKSLTPGEYNSCLGTIQDLEYFIYPSETPDLGFDRGTFNIYPIHEE
nr:hypothetical protein [uncultured Carboxylicivirga sp.]